MQEEIAALRAENAAFRRDMKGDYDLDAWLDWCYEAKELRGRVAALEKVAKAIDDKFTSGNSVPVERITLTRVEWEALQAAGYGGVE
jgi:hypothetical protein